MAAIISISSDDECSDGSEVIPKKKIKITADSSIICLDDEEDKNNGSNNEPNKAKENIIIESDEDTCCKNGDSTTKNESSNESNNSNKLLINGADISKKENDKNASSTATNSNFRKDEKEKIEHSLPQSSSSLAELFESSQEMQIFINTCFSQIQTKSTRELFKSKIIFCKKLFDKVGNDYVQSQNFKTFLQGKIELSKSSSIIAISSFNDVYQHLKVERINKKSNAEISSDHKNVLSKLEHTFRKIQKVIAKLEVAEVDFDDEEDSSFMKLQRYKDRAVKIHEKICKYKKEDAQANYILYTRLDFSGSDYLEFNHAINKKFRNNSVFPTYFDVQRCLEKTVKVKNMNLSDNRLKEEARICFKSLGELLQKRRKLDLLNIHSQYLTMNNDPADENPELDEILKGNFKEASSKINQICDKYTKLQEVGEEPTLSSDSDDSKQESTDDEEDNE